MNKGNGEEDLSLSSSSEEEEEETTSDLPRGNITTPYSSSSSSSSDEEEEEDSQDMEMEVEEDTLLADLKLVNDKLLAEPYAYDPYVAKIGLCRRLGDLEGLRETRGRMSALYPLSPQLWLDWLRDEQKVAEEADELKALEALFNRAINDYTSVEVWLEYVNFCLRHVQEEGGEEKCRQVFEKALTACGLHVSMGSLVWETYRDFEAALLATKTNDQTLLDVQEKRYVSLSKRQLSVPLLNMKASFKEIKSKIEIDSSTQTAYNKALARLAELELLEANLIQAPDDVSKVQRYRDYIMDEQKGKSNPARVQCIYERTLADFPLDYTLWIEYIDYLTRSAKIPDLILEVASRAARNCPWILHIWTKYLWVVESFMPQDQKQVLFDRIKSVFESAIIYFNSGAEAGTLWLKYLEALRRSVDINTVKESPDDQNRLDILRKTFDAAEQHLLQLVEEPDYTLSQILTFRARVEALVSGSLTPSVEDLWKEILSRGYGQYARIWSQYIMQRLKYGTDVKKIRSDLNKAMTYVRDDPQVIADIWINFERDYGDLASLSACEAKVARDLEKVSTMLNSQRQEGGGQSARHNQFNTNNRKGAKPDRKRKVQETAAAPLNKKGRVGDSSAGMDKQRRSIDMVDASQTSLDQQQAEFKVPFPPPTPPPIPGDSMAKETKSNEGKGKGEPVKHDPSKDPRTVFVSNLDFKVEEKELDEFFGCCGAVEEVRLVKNFMGKSKGFGYIFFINKESVEKALSQDRQLIRNRPVFISPCDPDKATRPLQFKYKTSLEKNKLFVKDLPLQITQEELTKIFETFGTLKACRLITNRNGSSKGLAYIEFEKESEASSAILRADGMLVEGKAISVAISNPPPVGKGQPSPSHHHHHHQPSYPKLDPYQKRVRNAFVPRALQLNTPTRQDGEGSSKEPSVSTPDPPKSNDDFRKMLLKR